MTGAGGLSSSLQLVTAKLAVLYLRGAPRRRDARATVAPTQVERS